MIPALTYENNSWDFYLWISQELHFQTMWSILNTPYGLCTLRTTFNWKKNCANTNHPALKSQLALLLPVSALLCLCFLHPHVYMFAVGILHPCLLKIPWATRQPRARLCSISWLTKRPTLQGEGYCENGVQRSLFPPFLSEYVSLMLCFLEAELFFLQKPFCAISLNFPQTHVPYWPSKRSLMERLPWIKCEESKFL